MIKFRRKEYSSKAVQALKTTKLVLNRANTAVKNAGLAAGDGLKTLVTGKRPTHPKFRFKPKTNMQLNRETVGIANSTKEITNEAVKGTADSIKNLPQTIKNAPRNIREGANKAMISEIGPAINNGVDTVVRHPDAAAALVVGKAAMPVGAAIGGWPGKIVAGAPYSALYPVLKKHSPMSKETLESLGRTADKYGKSKVGRALGKFKVTGSDIAAKLNNTPIPGINM